MEVYNISKRTSGNRVFVCVCNNKKVDLLALLGEGTGVRCWHVLRSRFWGTLSIFLPTVPLLLARHILCTMTGWTSFCHTPIDGRRQGAREAAAGTAGRTVG